MDCQLKENKIAYFLTKLFMGKIDNTTFDRGYNYKEYLVCAAY